MSSEIYGDSHRKNRQYSSDISEDNYHSRKEPVEEDITNNSFELLQTIKELKTETKTVKKENERILRAQEELNQILIDKFQSEVKEKHT